MFQRILAPLALALSFLLAPALASAGALVEHYTDCGTGGGFVNLVDPETGDLLLVNLPGPPEKGSFRRTEVDGSYWQHIHKASAGFTLVSASGIAMGEGSIVLAGTIVGPPDLCASSQYDLGFFNVHVTAAMVDLSSGEEFQLLIQAVVRNGEIKLFRAVQQ